MVKCVRGNLYEVSGKNIGDRQRTKIIVLSKTSISAKARAKSLFGLKNAKDVKSKLLEKNKLICK